MRPILSAFFIAVNSVFSLQRPSLIINKYTCFFLGNFYDFNFYVKVFEPFGIYFGIKNEVKIQLKIFPNGKPAVPMSFVR